MTADNQHETPAYVDWMVNHASGVLLGVSAVSGAAAVWLYHNSPFPVGAAVTASGGAITLHILSALWWSTVAVMVFGALYSLWGSYTLYQMDKDIEEADNAE